MIHEEGICEVIVRQGNGTLVAYGLGSCIGLFLYGSNPVGGNYGLTVEIEIDIGRVIVKSFHREGREIAWMK